MQCTKPKSGNPIGRVKGGDSKRRIRQANNQPADLALPSLTLRRAPDHSRAMNLPPPRGSQEQAGSDLSLFSPQRRSRTRCRPCRAKDPWGASAPRPQRGEDTGRLGRAPNLPPRRGPRCLFSHRFNAQQPKSRQLQRGAGLRSALRPPPALLSADSAFPPEAAGRS